MWLWTWTFTWLLKRAVMRAGRGLWRPKSRLVYPQHPLSGWTGMRVSRTVTPASGATRRWLTRVDACEFIIGRHSAPFWARGNNPWTLQELLPCGRPFVWLPVCVCRSAVWLYVCVHLYCSIVCMCTRRPSTSIHVIIHQLSPRPWHVTVNKWWTKPHNQ